MDALCAQKKCDALLLGRVQDLPAGKSATLKIVNPQTKSVLGELSAFLPLGTGEPLSWTNPNLSAAPLDAPAYARAGSDGIAMPKCRSCPDPKIPSEARFLKIEGTVVLSVLLSREGRPEKIVVLKRLGYGLDRIALETVRKWKFEPARGRDGSPVPVILPVEIAFRINL